MASYGGPRQCPALLAGLVYTVLIKGKPTAGRPPQGERALERAWRLSSALGGGAPPFGPFPFRSATCGLGLWQGSGDLGPGSAEFGVLDCVHRVAMSNEQSWHGRLGIGIRGEFANDGVGCPLRMFVVYLFSVPKPLVVGAAWSERGLGAAAQRFLKCSKEVISKKL